MIFPSRNQLIRDLSLTRTDQMEISKRRGDPHRLGFAYQLGFVRVFQRFPVQQPLEICEELLSFVPRVCGGTEAKRSREGSRLLGGLSPRVRGNLLHEPS